MRNKLNNSVSSTKDTHFNPKEKSNNKNVNVMSKLTTPKRKEIFEHFEDNNNDYKNDGNNINDYIGNSIEDSQTKSVYVPETPKSTNKRKRNYVSDDDDSYVQENRRKKPKTLNVSLNNFQIPPTSFYSKQSLEKSSERFFNKKATLSTSPTKETNQIHSSTNNEISSKIKNLLSKKNFNEKLSRNKRRNLYSKQSKQLPPKLGHNVGHRIRTRKIRKPAKKPVPKKPIKFEKQRISNSNTVKQKTERLQRQLSFSESEDSDDDDDELLNLNYDDEIKNKIDENQQKFEEEQEQKDDGNTTTKRKFFLTNRKPIGNEIKILRNVKMTMFNGKLRVLPTEKEIRNHGSNKTKKKKKRRDKKFSKEHAAVSEIIRQLSCSPELCERNPQEPQCQEPQKEPASASAIIGITEPINDDHTLKTQNIDELKTPGENFNEPYPISYDDNLILEDYKEFRSRIPFNTNDPGLIERQHLLLEFLITYGICNEETFKIFIEDPENNKDKAENIINNLTVITSKTNEEYDDTDLLIENEKVHTTITRDVTENCEISDKMNKNQNGPFTVDHELNSNDKCEKSIEHGTFKGCVTPENIEDQKEDDRIIEKEKNNKEITDTTTTSNFSDIQIEETEMCENYADDRNPSFDHVEMNENSNSNDNGARNQSNSTKLFPIFCNRNENAAINEDEVSKIALPTLPLPVKQNKRIARKGVGNDQLQIDAGQKEFGAKECLQCGLLYTVHEPEEEKLHEEYHQSLHVLRFRGWIDENLVKEYPEWGSNGRIIYITDSSNIKRKERLMNVLNVVDKELGFASYIFPSKFVAYLAIRLNQIVGLCLVQPLEKANKYLCIDGVDCCSTEQFDVKCGISRIWVSKPHRKMGIASKLITAVQNHTMPGIEISLDQIAFSAPTEDGKIFARKITKRDDFLVY